MFTRKLGKSGIDVSAMGLGCYAIGGPFWRADHDSVSWQKDDGQLPASRQWLRLRKTPGRWHSVH